MSESGPFANLDAHEREVRRRNREDRTGDRQTRREITPDKWQQANPVIGKPVRRKTLIDLPANFFAGSQDWTIRLVARHKNGKSREARFYLKLG